MEIKVLGSGCPKCKKLEQTAKDAVARAGIEAEITKVADMMKIMEYGVMRTPALVIDEKVAFSGRVPSVQEIVHVFTTKK